MAGHLVNVDAVEDWRIRSAVMKGGNRSRRFPPHRALLEHPVSPIPLPLVFGSVRQLFVVAEHDDALPLKATDDFIRLNTDARVRAHPLDLLATRRKSVKMPFVVSEIDGYNIRLIVVGTRDSAKAQSPQCINTLLIGHLVNEHCGQQGQEVRAIDLR